MCTCMYVLVLVLVVLVKKNATFVCTYIHVPGLNKIYTCKIIYISLNFGFFLNAPSRGVYILDLNKSIYAQIY